MEFSITLGLVRKNEMTQLRLLLMLCLLTVDNISGNRLALTNEDAEKLLDHLKNYAKEKPYAEDVTSMLSSQEVEDLVVPLSADDCLPMGEEGRLPKQLEDAPDVWDVEESHLGEADGASVKFKKNTNNRDSDLVYTSDSAENALGSLVPGIYPFHRNTEPTLSNGKRDYAFGCDCKIKNTVIDLGVRYYPRYLLNAVCDNSYAKHPPKCRKGTLCKALEYRVTVLAWRTDYKKKNKDRISRGLWLPDDLKRYYALKTITVAAGCVCAF